MSWSTDPDERKVYLYRAGQALLEVNDRGQLSGDGVLPGFTLDLATLG